MASVDNQAAPVRDTFSIEDRATAGVNGAHVRAARVGQWGVVGAGECAAFVRSGDGVPVDWAGFTASGD
jgi:hypothetical protein